MKLVIMISLGLCAFSPKFAAQSFGKRRIETGDYRGRRASSSDHHLEILHSRVPTVASPEDAETACSEAQMSLGDNVVYTPPLNQTLVENNWYVKHIIIIYSAFSMLIDSRVSYLHRLAPLHLSASVNR